MSLVRLFAWIPAPAILLRQIWIRLAPAAPFDGVQGRYDVLFGSQVLATGTVELGGFNPAAITVDPIAHTVKADNLIVRTVP